MVRAFVDGAIVLEAPPEIMEPIELVVQRDEPTTQPVVPVTPSRPARPIRTRVVAACVAILAGGLLVAILATRQVLLSDVEEEIESELTQEVAELRRLVDRVKPAPGEPPTDAAAVFDEFLAQNVPGQGEAFFTLVDGKPYAWSFDPPVQLLNDERLVASWRKSTNAEWGSARTAIGEARYLVVPLMNGREPAGHFVAAISPQSRVSDVHEVVYVFLLIGVLVLISAFAFAWRAAGRVIAPVRALTRTARRVSETEMSARIPVASNDELGELSETFNEMLDRLEHAFQSQRDFLDDVAHELRTPITIVRGQLELLGDDPHEREETVGLVTDELDRMNRYVNDLLLLARARRRDFLDMTLVDFAEVADSALVRACVLAPRRWSIGRAPAPGELLGMADEDRLGQAILNLAANAARHTDAGDEITIAVEQVGETVKFWVSDTGPGIDAALEDSLFTRFSESPDAVRDSESTGLGLAIVAAIAQAHGGSVELMSQQGEGATFCITIPLRRGPHADEEMS